MSRVVPPQSHQAEINQPDHTKPAKPLGGWVGREETVGDFLYKEWAGEPVNSGGLSLWQQRNKLGTEVGPRISPETNSHRHVCRLQHTATPPTSLPSHWSVRGNIQGSNAVQSPGNKKKRAVFPSLNDTRQMEIEILSCFQCMPTMCHVYLCSFIFYLMLCILCTQFYNLNYNYYFFFALYLSYVSLMSIFMCM